MKSILLICSIFSIPFLLNPALAQAPDLGTASSFAVFTGAGAFTNDGATIVTGDIGTNVGLFSGFPPGIVFGEIHVSDAESAAAATAVTDAYGDLAALTCGQVIGTTLGNGQILTQDVYCLGAASTLNGDLILDGENDPGALFIFKIDGALSTTTLSNVLLINGASLCNVWWQINGAFDLGEGSHFKGSILANGAISLLEGAELLGRALATVGAVDLHNNIVSIGLAPEAAMVVADGPVSFCVGGSVVLSGNVDGVWNTGAETSSITVSTSGDFFVVNTTLCGSDTSNHIQVTVNPPPPCTITGDNVICEGASSELCTPLVTGNTYLWSTGETTNCITVDTAGIFTVTVTDQNGCSSICSETVTVNPLPLCTITGDNVICEGASSELCTPLVTGNSYLWSTGESTNCITVDTAGIFTVTVTDQNGCSSVCSETVTVNPPPLCTITGDNVICEGASSELCTPLVTGNTYLWSTGETTNCITVDTAGLFTVTVTDQNGCSSVCSETVTVNPPPPCTITGDNVICEGASSELCTPLVTGNTYLWSTGESTNCITVDTAGLFTVTVTDQNGCSSVCSETVTVGPPPTCTITGDNTLCEGESSQLCVPAGAASYLWSTGEITNCITVDTAGLYSVTVTYLGGCSSICSDTVTVNPLPLCTITGDNVICEGASSELCTPLVTGNSYLWSTGETTNCITVDTAGLFAVTVTDQNGCSSVCSETVTVNPPPPCTITGDNVICEGASSELCTPLVAGNSYLWSAGETTNCITVISAGIFSVTVTDANGCSSVCSETVAINPLPLCTITGDNVICEGESSELCTPLITGNTYLWSTGETTNCITVDTAGIFTVTVTDQNGCSSVCSETVTVNPLPLCTITGDNVICEGASSELCTPLVTGNSYLWSTGETTNCITVDTAGIFTVTVTDQNGCSSVCSETVTVNPPPLCTITGDNVICEGASSELCTPLVTGNSYLWSTGETTNCITVDTAGIFTVTVTDQNGCSSVCSETVTVNPPPLCTITGDNVICEGASSELCTPLVTGNSYLWSTGETTNCITVDTAGIFTVTVTDQNGCSSVCSETVTVNPPPLCTITGDNVICEGASSELCTPLVTGNSYLWSTGETTNCITVDTAGIFTVTVTDQNGCSSVCSETVTVNPPPLCTITGDNVICEGASSELCTPLVTGNSYLWSTGETTNCITVDTAGIFTVTVTDQNGCSSVCSETVTVNPPPPCTITGDNVICEGASSELCTPLVTGNSYLWSTGESTNCITVDTAGIFTVTVTDQNGCSSVCSETVTVNPPPDCTITGDNVICEGASSELCTPLVTGNSYLWSTGESTNCITVDTAGIFTVTVTDQNGCSSVCSETVTVGPPPTCTITGDNTLCEGESSQLCVPAGAASYLWSTGETTNCITVDTAGLYSVTVTYLGGCSSVCSETVTVNPLPLCTITGDNVLCEGESSELCTPLVAGNSYLWSTGETTNCITVDTVGIFTVTVTDQNGCSSVCSETVTVNPLPLCTITGDNVICEGASSELCTPLVTGNSYLWSTGESTNCITVDTAGIFTVTVTDQNGCSSVCSDTVTVNPPPDCTITGDNVICEGASSELCTPLVTGNTYLWSTGETTNCITVDTAGIFTVTVTDQNGCSSVCSDTVTVNPPPDCTITGDNVICEGASSELCIPLVTGNSYLWSTGETTNCITVDTAGIFTVTVTDQNGCSSVCSETVTVGPPPTCTITGDNTLCEGESSQLCVPAGAASYLWSTGETTNCITVDTAGLYSVTVTYLGGCSSVCSETVTVNPLPLCTITGDNVLCEGESSELCTPLVAGNSYLWSTGETTNCITVDTAGIFTVTVTDQNGCSSVCSETVTVNPLPLCTITGDNVICEGASSELCTPLVTGNSYLWSTGETTNCITVDTAGLFTVTITDGSGCSSVCSETVTVNPPPDCTITGDNVICEGASSELCTPLVTGNSYLWSTGETTNCITVDTAGIFTVTVTDQNGCSSVCSDTVTVNPPPDCTITGDNVICEGASSELCTPLVTGNTYLWSTGETTNCITVDTAGIFTVTVTDQNGCSSVCSETVTVGPPPTCTITGDNTLCEGESGQLCVPAGAASYLWSTGEITNCITVDTAGLYSVTVTYLGGCSSVCSDTVTVNPLPLCTITGDNVLCEGGSSELCTPLVTGSTYLWSTGETTNCITVDTAGIFTVTVTDQNGCSSVCSDAVTVNPPPPCTITGDTVLCEGESSELCTPLVTGNTYLWSTGETTNCITVDTAGLFTVTITDGSGCASVCSETVTVNPPPPCTITGDNVLCEGESSELCTPFVAGNTYLWSTGETTNCITVDTAGLFTVTVTDGNGCSSVCSETVTVNPPPPCIITGEDLVCEGQSTELCTPPGALDYLWSTGATTNCITVSTEGTYTVTITDVNGCSSFCSRTVLINEQPPSITCPASITIECTESTLPSNTGSATAPDNCNLPPVISFSDISVQGTCPQESTITRTWTASSGATNSSSCVQMITLEDSSPPMINCPASITIECDESTLPLNTGMATAIDGCDLSPVIAFNDVTSTGLCPQEITIARTWTATDACGNSTSCVQMITVLDNTPPAITLLNPLLANGDTIYVQCYGQDPLWDLPQFDENSVEVTDICNGNVTVDYSQLLLNEGDCANDGYIVLYLLTWIATDACGNSSTAWAFMALVDTIPPVIYGVPGDITVNCDAIPDLPVLVYATDECLCACVILLQESELSAGCQNGGVLLRSWTAIDRCGNETVATQRITLVDDAGPLIAIIQPELAGMQDGAVLEYTCGEGGMPDFLDMMDANSVFIDGECGSDALVIFSVTSSEVHNCEFYGYIEQRTYQWTAVDACGNTSSMTIFARLIENEAPMLIGVPEMACIGDPALENIYATGNCAQTFMHFWDVNIPNPCGSGMAVRRVYEAYDVCGNTTIDTTILVPNDESNPSMEIVNPLLTGLVSGQDLVANCAANAGRYTSFDVDDVGFTGACSEGVTTTFTERLLETGDCVSDGFVAIVELQWTATDICGNFGEFTLIAHVVDESSPVFVNFQPNVTIGCNDALPELSATDNCGDVSITTRDSIIYGDCAFEYIMHRVVTATDNCGNSTTRLQTVQVGDGSGPVIEGVEGDMCDDLTIPVVTGYDACAGVFVEVTMEQDTIDVPCRDGLVIERTWTATNVCGNVTVIHQTIVMHDQTPPEILIPSSSIINDILYHGFELIFLSQTDLVLQINLLDENSVLVSDECDQDIIPVLTVNILLGNCAEDGYSERREYTWVATDACGNTASVSVTVDLIDDLPPEMLVIPADTLIVCAELPPVPDMLVDSLAGETIVYTQVITQGQSPNEFLVTRTWDAMDLCNNASQVIQHITWLPETNLECEVLLPVSVDCNSHGVVVGSMITGGFAPLTYEWEVVGGECFIQGGQGTPEIIIYVGWEDVKVSLSVTDAFGCVSMCMVVLHCDPAQISNLSQVDSSYTFQANSYPLGPFAAKDMDTLSRDMLTQLNLWPNPATGSFSLAFESAVDHLVQFTLMNSLGRVIMTEEFDAFSGLNTITTPVDHITPGSYLIVLKTATEIYARGIVIMPRE